MKKIFTSMLLMLIATLAFAVKVNSTSAQSSKSSVEEKNIVMSFVDADVSNNEAYLIYDNEDFKLYFDIIKNLPIDPNRTYTLEDMDIEYSYLKNKNSLLTNKYGTKEYEKYTYTSVNVKLGANNELEATIEATNGTDVITGNFVFNNPNPIPVTLSGVTEYIEGMAYGITAKNKGSELKEDYSVAFGIKTDAYESKTTFTADDMMANGRYVKIAAQSDDKIAEANITLTKNTDSQTYTGTITGTSGKVYNINITTNIPSTEAKKETIDFGSILKVEEDEGDIKLTAENEDCKFVGYITITPVTTDIPSGEYDLLSYSKYGKNTQFGYMLDAVENGKVTVTNNNGEILIVATFKQEGIEYTVNAKTAIKSDIEMATITITKGEKAITISSSNDTYALLTKFKLVSELDEEETPESVVLDELEEISAAFNNAEDFQAYYVDYSTKGKKECDIDGIEEVYPGEKFFIVGCNIAWSEKENKVVIASNLAVDYLTVPSESGISNINNNAVLKNGKYTDNGKITIVKNGRKYNVTGINIK